MKWTRPGIIIVMGSFLWYSLTYDGVVKTAATLFIIFSTLAVYKYWVKQL